MTLRIFLLTLLAASLAACTSFNQRTSVQVGFYDVRGTSFAELDEEISLHGPQVSGVGKAIAATNVQMRPNIQFAVTDGKCRVTSAQVKVVANVTLPRLRDRRRVRKELQGAFLNIENYAKLHEAVHVAIADQHAEIAENEIKALPPAENCELLKQQVIERFDAVMVRHEAAQLQFDAEEKVRAREARREGESSKALNRT